MIDPSIAPVNGHWTDGTTPYWTAIALWYCLTAVRLRAFASESYPTWCWGSFLGVGASIFLLINGDHLFPPDSAMIIMVEYFAMVVIVGVGVVLYRLSKAYVEDRSLRDRIEASDFEVDFDELD